MFWEQPGFQVSQKLTIIRSETTLPSCRKHFNDLLNRYSKIHIVNLLKQNDPMSPECVLGDAYRSQVNQLKDLKSLIVFTGFDFHYAVKRDNYDKLKSLVDMVSYAFEENGYFLCDVSKNAIISTQTGIFRTNCLDCLDRTNVVQTLFAKYSIEQYFRAIGSSRIVDSEPFTSVFNSLWADNGDWLSMIYTGTGALKSSYTRKGKTTLAGFLDDAAKSATRLYVNNFQDKSRQEAIDLLLGKVPSSYVTLIRDPVFEYVLNELIVRYISLIEVKLNTLLFVI